MRSASLTHYTIIAGSTLHDECFELLINLLLHALDDRDGLSHIRPHHHQLAQPGRHAILNAVAFSARLDQGPRVLHALLVLVALQEVDALQMTGLLLSGKRGKGERRGRNSSRSGEILEAARRQYDCTK